MRGLCTTAPCSHISLGIIDIEAYAAQTPHNILLLIIILRAVHPQPPHIISFCLELFALNGVTHFTFVKRSSLCSQFSFCCDAKSGFLPECVVFLRQQNTKTRLMARTKQKETMERKKKPPTK